MATCKELTEKELEKENIIIPIGPVVRLTEIIKTIKEPRHLRKSLLIALLKAITIMVTEMVESGGAQRNIAEMACITNLLAKQTVGEITEVFKIYWNIMKLRIESNNAFDEIEELEEEQKMLACRILDELGECCICLDKFRARESIVATKCEHVMHNECIQAWILKGNNCPICRKTL